MGKAELAIAVEPDMIVGRLIRRPNKRAGEPHFSF